MRSASWAQPEQQPHTRHEPVFMNAVGRSRHPVSTLYMSAALGGWVLPGAICALLAATLMVGGTREVGRLLDARAAARLPDRTATASGGSTVTDSNPTTDLGSLANSLLFGRYTPPAADVPATAAVKPPAAAELPETSPGELPEAGLGVTLRGVVFATEPAARRAIIDGGSGPFKDYRIGDSLPGDAIIRYIETHRIVVEKGGELLAVSLPETAGGAALIVNGMPENFPPALPTTEGMSGIPGPN